MKLTTTLDGFPEHFLRRMVSWCCRQIDFPIAKVRQAQFRNRSRGYSGRAWHSMRIHVAVGSAVWFPTSGHLYPGRKSEAYRAPKIQDRTEAVVAITAHELTHLQDYDSEKDRIGNPAFTRGPGERRTMYNERRVLELFRQSREALVAEWSQAPTEKPAVPLVERRAAKALADLERWQRKLKLAQTKVRKLKTRVRYYERRQAANKSN